MGPTDHLIHLGSPTLKYRRLRCDMSEVFKIIEHLVHEFIYGQGQGSKGKST